MKNEFDQKQDLSQPSVRLQNRDLELSPRQSEIYRNLEAIGPRNSCLLSIWGKSTTKP